MVAIEDGMEETRTGVGSLEKQTSKRKRANLYHFLDVKFGFQCLTYKIATLNIMNNLN